MSDVGSSLIAVGDGAWETEREISLWSPNPVSVRFEVTGAPNGPAQTTVDLLVEVESSVSTLWPAIQQELLAMTNVKEAWRLLARLDSLTVHVTDGSSRWTLAATFSGKLDGTTFFVDIDGGEVVHSDAVD